MKEKRFFLPSQCKHSRILKKILKLKVKCLEISLENYWDSSWQKTILAKRKGRFACVICFFIGKTGFSWKKCVLICTFVYLKDNEYGNRWVSSAKSLTTFFPRRLSMIWPHQKQSFFILMTPKFLVIHPRIDYPT